MLERVLARIEADQGAQLARLFALLRVPSISTDPAHAEDCDTAADLLVADLCDIGLEARKLATSGQPMVLARHEGPGPHLLFYGHYDVQPADPLELWEGDPFEPELIKTARGPAIRARGASDDKGQLMTFIEAIRAWKAETGTLPCRVTVLLEGEEESGSESLEPFLRAHADELRADLAVVCDTGLFADRPAIVTRLRGLLAEEIIVRGADRDLHSGMYGGLAMNPVHALARVIAELHDSEGRITLPGFYDDVRDPAPETLAAWEALGFDAGSWLGEVGLSTPAGERGRLPLEMIWSRPSMDVNGIAGGYAGAGFKTVLPCEARAKLSFRLVPDQDPHRIRETLRRRVRESMPPDAKVEFTAHGAGPGVLMDTGHPAFGWARAALAEEWGVQPVETGCGGSIPVVGAFREILGIDSLLTGFARDDDNIHAPNEKYDLASFRKGIRSWARFLARVETARGE